MLVEVTSAGRGFFRMLVSLRSSVSAGGEARSAAWWSAPDEGRSRGVGVEEPPLETRSRVDAGERPTDEGRSRVELEERAAEEGRSKVDAGERPLDEGRSRVEAGDRGVRRSVLDGERSSERRGIIEARVRVERGSGSAADGTRVRLEKCSHR